MEVPRLVRSSVFGRRSGKSATLGRWGWECAASRGQRTVANPLNCERKTAGGRGNYKAINRELCYVWELKYIFDCFGIDPVSFESLGEDKIRDQEASVWFEVCRVRIFEYITGEGVCNEFMNKIPSFQILFWRGLGLVTSCE